MICHPFHEKNVSALALGCMRFPLCGDTSADVDMDKTRAIVDYAMTNGVNYFDTAWFYHDGQSESIMGKLLGAYPRDSYYLATKFPGCDLKNIGKVEEIFEKQLERCGVDYFDFYLLHNVSDENIDAYTDPQNRIFAYLREQKAKGRIHHLGFSSHGSVPMLRRFLAEYADDMEFCQLQISWFDFEMLHTAEKLELMAQYGIPVWVMEPVRGGALVNLKPEYEVPLRALRPQASNAEWAFRFLQTFPQIKVILSGMSDLQQITENIRIFSEHKPLNETEMDTVVELRHAMTAKKALHCTSCRYCAPHCPQGLDIPQIIKLYNEHICERAGFKLADSLYHLPDEHNPARCIGCGACEEACPQHIGIAAMMAEFAKAVTK